MFEPFQKFIARAAVQYGVTKEMEAAKICQDFRSLMPELFKDRDEADTYISPANFKDSTLTLNVENPAWAQEVLMRKPKIIHEMNKKIGKQIIKNLKTQLRQKQDC